MSKSASNVSINLDADEGEQGSVQEIVDVAPAAASASASDIADSVPGTSTSSPCGPDTKKKAVKVDANRCQVCRKKVGLTGIKCRCGGLFCHQHRYSDEHDCTFDYRQLGAEEIRKNNPVVVGEKIRKI